MDYLNNLNEQQKKAVLHKDGPCLVLAGAGSGKTKVLTTRIAYLIDSGVPSYKILAITFTNKAAKEMKERLEKMVPDNNAFVGTFHSLGVRIIRENAPLLHIDRNFSILDSDDVLWRNLVELGYLHQAFTGIVHVSGGLDDNYILPVYLTLAPKALVLLFAQENTMLFSEHIHSEIAHIVPCVKILFTRITEPGYYPHP